MVGQPVADGTTAVAGQIVGDKVEIPMRLGMVERLEKCAVGARSTRDGGLGQHLSIAHAQRP